MSQAKDIYQFKLTLSRVRPPVWRRIEVQAEITLHRLAVALITAMGWHGGHMHQFRIDGQYYGLPQKEFTDDIDIIDERKEKLKDIIVGGSERFIFEYDFGDGWEHAVQFEGVVEPKPGIKYPRCIKGARQCPPEDCGGPHGYADFLKAIGDPKHPEHESMLEWIGGDFDPEEFDLKEFSNLARGVENMGNLWK